MVNAIKPVCKIIAANKLSSPILQDCGIIFDIFLRINFSLWLLVE